MVTDSDRPSTYRFGMPPQRAVAAVLAVLTSAALAGVPSGAIAPAFAGSAETAAVPATTTPTDLPPSSPGRLAYSTGVYTQDSQGSGISVHGLGAIGLDGTDQRVLTDPSDPGSFDHSPQWSPDGSWLAYLQFTSTPDGGTNSVAVLPRDGGQPQVLDASGYGPAWSPDGLHLAWVSIHSDGSYGVTVADVFTTPTAIDVLATHDYPMPAQPGWPTFSPDGLSLTFALGNYFANAPDPGADLYTMSVTGTGLQQVSHGLRIEPGNGNYSWSPDGVRLLTLAETDANPGAPTAYVLDRDGSHQHKLFDGGESVYEDAATWTPTGDAVALVTNSPYSGIRLVRLDGTVVRTLAMNKFQSWGGLTYSPDGSRIYSVATPGNGPGSHTQYAPDLFAIPTNGDPVVQLTTDHSVFPGTVQAVDPGRVLREFGGNVITTAVDAVRSTVRSASTVVLARSDRYDDALAAGPLAGTLHAPVMLTPMSGLAPAVAAQIKRLRSTHAVLVGRLSSAVAQRLRALGLTVSRTGYAWSPNAVAGAVARRLGHSHAVIVPNAGASTDWQLPLAAGGWAAYKRFPMLWARHGSLPDATRLALRDAGVKTVTVIGDDTVVRPGLLADLHHMHLTVLRVRAHNRYVVSATLAERLRQQGARIGHPILSTGGRWTDALAAPALSALTGQVSLLVAQATLTASAATANWLSDHRTHIGTARLIGRIGAARPRVEAQLEHRLHVAL